VPRAQFLRIHERDTMEISQLKPGHMVRVRRRTWVVTDVDTCGTCSLLTLAGAGVDAVGRTCRVLHPFDDVETTAGASRLRRVGIGAWRHACRALLLEQGDAASLRTAATARIELLPFQLEPALAVLQGRGARLLLADEVGLGKTIQAALVVAELRARGAARRVLVICPAGLREQWAAECAERFDLSFAVFDQSGLRAARANLPVGLNPWTTAPLVVTSVDFVKRPEVLPAVVAARWDMVVVDEAHGSAGPSDRRDAVSALCARSPYVLLLSATPHNGDEEAFASLCAMGDHADSLLVFRRTRLEAGHDAGRRAHTLWIAPTPAEQRMHAALAALTRAIRSESIDMHRQVWLMLTLLHKRALSSAFALAESAERRLRLLHDTAVDSAEQLALPLDDGSGELDATDAARMWSEPALRDGRKERRLLERLAEAARGARGQEAKLRRLRRLLAAVHEPVIVFTEYRDTLLHLRDQVAPQAAVLHGGLSRLQRRTALGTFASGGGVLLATDAAGEGLNLQRHARVVINLELPWNPMRLEQRVGRVDRIGQERRVHVIHLVSKGTGEERLRQRLAERVSKARARVGAHDPMCGRPEWTEESAARLVVLDAEPVQTDTLDQMTAPRLPLTRLTDDAHLEAARVADMQTLAATSRTTGVARARRSCTPLFARSRRARLRLALQGRTLAMLETAINDGDGRRVATRVDALLCSGVAPSVEALRALSRADLSPLFSERDAWITRSLERHARFADVRLHRARAVAAMQDAEIGATQPGLFDRRAERFWQTGTAGRQDAQAADCESVDRAESAARTSVSGAKPVLLLTCGGQVER
jgi:superfamily II DNA or RNA helicase